MAKVNIEKYCEKLMTADEAAAKWKLSISTVKRMCKDGEVDAVKIGVSWVMFEDTLNPRRP